MNAGLPGTGLGGLFYIIGALWMPVGAVYGRIRGRRDIAWPVILRQSGIAAGVLVLLWLTGWAVGYMVELGASASPGAGADGVVPEPRAITSAIRWATLLGTAGVLSTLVAGVQVLRLVVHRPLRWNVPVPEVGVVNLPRPTEPATARPELEVA